MFRYFGKSRGVFAAGLVLTAALAAAMAVRRADREPWVALVTVGLALALGVVLSLLAANLAATGCEQAAQEKLHLALDPEGFLRAYGPAVARMKPGSPARCRGAASLAEGLCAAGRWQEALEALEEPGAAVPEGRRAALEALVLRCRCRYWLWGGQPGPAGEALEALKALLTAQTAANPSLAMSLRQEVRLFGVWQHLLEGGQADRAGLEELMRRQPTKLGKLDVCWMLLLDSRNAGDEEARRRYAALLAQEGGGLACARALREA